MKDAWTVVQHSGFGYSGKSGFKHATEVRKLNTKAELDTVKKVGGVVFDFFNDADSFSEVANYPVGYPGMYPAAKGTFSKKKIDDLAIYIPVRVEVG